MDDVEQQGSASQGSQGARGARGARDVRDVRGMLRDADRPRSRREVLALLGGLGAGVVLVGCGSGGDSSESSASSKTSSDSGATSTASASTTTTTPAATVTSCAVIPEETGGPYPGDGSNGPNALALDGIVRSDITPSFAGSSGVATGVPLTIKLTVVDTAKSCALMSGAAVYLWHCDNAGAYSMYSQGASGENYLRGVQPVGSDGTVTFTSIFPAAYSGRWPHIHFQVYPSVSAATSSSGKLRTSQLALPEDVCEVVFATSEYPSSSSNLARSSLNSDNVFSDGWDTQLATVTGSVASGYTADLLVGI